MELRRTTEEKTWSLTTYSNQKFDISYEYDDGSTELILSTTLRAQTTKYFESYLCADFICLFYLFGLIHTALDVVAMNLP